MNPNDLDDVRHSYNRAISTRRAWTQLSTGLLALALLVAVLFPARGALGSTSRASAVNLVWSGADNASLTLGVDASVSGARTEEDVELLVRGFPAPTADLSSQVVLLRHHGEPDLAGDVKFSHSIPVARGSFERIAVGVGTPDETQRCLGLADISTGCVVTTPPALIPASPAFELSVKDSRLDGKVRADGVEGSAVLSTVILGIPAEEGQVRPLLYRGQSGPNEAGLAEVPIGIPIPSGMSFVLVRATVGPMNSTLPDPAECAPDSFTPGCVVLVVD